MDNIHDITLYLAISSTYSHVEQYHMENKPKSIPNPESKLMDQVREILRYYHYARFTENTYCQWVLRFLYFYDKKRHPKDMGCKEVERFLSHLIHLATHEKVATSTQRQALHA